MQLKFSLISIPRSVLRSFVLMLIACSGIGVTFGQQNAATKSESSAPPAAAASTPAQSTPRTEAGASAAHTATIVGVETPAMAKPEPLLDANRRPLYETIQEDWSSLQIGTSKLEPLTPVVGEVAQEDKFTRALVQVQWRPGDPIDLWIVLPKGVKKPPIVVYLYNYLEDPLRFHNDGWCERVTSGGVAAVGFLSALSTDRFRDRPMKQWFVSELQESLGSTVHDVKFILDYLNSRGDLDMTRVGMFGEGSGGAIAILAAAADPRIKAVDALDPWGNWPEFLTQSPVVSGDPDRENYGKPEFLKKVAPLEPVKWLPKLKTPIRVQQVKHNLAVPMECKDAIKAALPKQAELIRFEGVSELARRESGGGLFEWIKEKVQSPSKPGLRSPKLIAAKSSAAQAPINKNAGAQHQ